MGLSKEERRNGYKTVSRPTDHTVAILRRVAAGTIVVTHREDRHPSYSYEDGTPVRDELGYPIKPHKFALMVREGWLIPVAGGSLFGEDFPQQYRARKPTDPALPRVRKGRRRR